MRGREGKRVCVCGGGGVRKIMASAARREVGEEGEIELLTWGMRYAQREKEFTLLLAR